MQNELIEAIRQNKNISFNIREGAGNDIDLFFTGFKYRDDAIILAKFFRSDKRHGIQIHGIYKNVGLFAEELLKVIGEYAAGGRANINTNGSVMHIDIKGEKMWTFVAKTICLDRRLEGDGGNLGALWGNLSREAEKKIHELYEMTEL